MIVEVSSGSGLRIKFISVCQLSSEPGKYQVSRHDSLTKIMILFAVCVSGPWTGGEGNQRLSYICDWCHHSPIIPPPCQHTRYHYLDCCIYEAQG